MYLCTGSVGFADHRQGVFSKTFFEFLSEYLALPMDGEPQIGRQSVHD